MLKRSLFIFGWFFFLPLKVYAWPIEKVEQQINLLTQEYVTTSAIAAPTDNSLGIIEWDTDAYPNATIDFEAIVACQNCSGGNQAAKAMLYDENGQPVSGIYVTTQNTTYRRSRITDIGSYLSDNTKYTVRLLVDATSGTASIKAARLIITQAATSINRTRTTIELGSPSTTTNTAYSVLALPKIFLFKSSRQSDITASKLHATLRSTGSGSVALAALSSSSTCATTLGDSEVSVTGTAWSMPISSDFKIALSDNTEYWVCLKSDDGNSAELVNASLVIDQQDNNGIDAITTPLHLVTYLQEHNGDFLLSGFDNQFDPTHFIADRKKAYFEAILKRSGGEAVADLYNTTHTSSISNSQLQTDSSPYIRKTSNDVYTSLPAGVGVLDTRLKNTTGSISSLSSSWLLMELSKTPDAALSFVVTGVDENTVHNGITTSLTTTSSSLPFGNMIVTTPKYAAHSLFVSTNASSGYRVTVKMLHYMQGNYPANNIDPFVGNWSTPTTWTEPTGTTPNDNTGWIGANTTDTRVNGWDEGALKFGPVNSTENIVMQSSGEDTGTTVYVTYALESNIWQPSDLYSGTIIYNLIPLY